ncbi:MAG: hypothetical protein M3R08_07515 [Bacteroidota bacterium]|nr:hypothetical protein [Bacteroidota bacterium]
MRSIDAPKFVHRIRSIHSDQHGNVHPVMKEHISRLSAGGIFGTWNGMRPLRT